MLVENLDDPWQQGRNSFVELPGRTIRLWVLWYPQNSGMKHLPYRGSLLILANIEQCIFYTKEKEKIVQFCEIFFTSFQGQSAVFTTSHFAVIATFWKHTFRAVVFQKLYKTQGLISRHDVQIILRWINERDESSDFNKFGADMPDVLNPELTGRLMLALSLVLCHFGESFIQIYVGFHFFDIRVVMRSCCKDELITY